MRSAFKAFMGFVISQAKSNFILGNQMLSFEIPNFEKVRISDSLFVWKQSKNGRVHKQDTHLQTELEPVRINYGAVWGSSLNKKEVAIWEELWISTRTLTFYRLCRLYPTKQETMKRLKSSNIISVWRYATFKMLPQTYHSMTMLSLLGRWHYQFKD